MTLDELKKEVDKYIALGYGGKTIVIEDHHDNREIDSIQMNTFEGIEPDYLFIMKGD